MIKLSENKSENKDFLNQKLKIDIENESDNEYFRKQILLHLDDMQILDSEDGKRIKRDFERFLKINESEVTMEDIDYEIYKYINKLAIQYTELDDLLKQNCSTFSEALSQAEKFREKFYSLLEQYSVNSQNLAAVCCDLMERIEQQPGNPDLKYLYLCVVTDFGLLNQINAGDRTQEQEIRNYFRQKKSMQKLIQFMKSQSENLKKYHELLEYLKRPDYLKNNINDKENSDFLYNLTINHTFLYGCKSNEIYKDNLNALQMYINNDKKLKSVKPYIIFAVLSRRTGMMQKRKHFIPNLKSVFQYQSYNIYKDNGKNFNQYTSELELYDHLKRSFIDENDIDMELCDFCFANLSPLSEWYYMNCEPNEDIPMTLSQKILTEMPESFPYILNYEDYDRMNDDEIQLYSNAAKELMEKMLLTAENFLKII